MQLKHIEYFVKTSTYRSFNEAAKNLFISQPSLSAAIATLENELGFPLFLRSKNGIVLSAEGEIILPQAKQILEIQNQWLNMPHTASISGEIKITAPDIICSTILLELIIKASQKYPLLKISLRGESPKLVPPILSNHFLSLAMNFVKPSDLPDYKNSCHKNAWEILPLADTCTLLFLNTAHPFAKQESLSFAQLSQFKLVTYEQYTTLPYTEIFSSFHKDQIKKLPTREAMFNLIAKEPNYIGVFSSICINNCSYIKDGIICAKPIKDYPTPLKLVLQFPQDRENDLLLCTIKELLLDSIGIILDVP